MGVIVVILFRLFFKISTPFGRHLYFIAVPRFCKRVWQIFLTFFLRLLQVVYTQQLVSRKKSWLVSGHCLYKVYARARKAVVAVGGVAVAIHDTFISTSARNAQYSTALPYVKPRQIAQNRLVLPN